MERQCRCRNESVKQLLTPSIKRERSGGGRKRGRVQTMGRDYVGGASDTSRALHLPFRSFSRKRSVTFQSFYREKCHYYILLTIHDTLGYQGRVSNTLWQSFILIRVFVTKLFQKNVSSNPLKRLVVSYDFQLEYSDFMYFNKQPGV